jgi:hypothetical protein
MGAVSPLTPAQHRALARLSREHLLDDLYLAGGVGVALYLHHRRSVDLDFFSRRIDLDLDRTADRLAAIGAEIIELTDAAVSSVVESVPVDIVRYPYRLIGRLAHAPENTRLASLRDLAAMKLAAIARRGIRRDFWDLYEIVARGSASLSTTLDDYARKFGRARADVYHVIRSLTWFEDAERDRVLPRGMTVAKWRAVRTWFETAAAAELARRAR